MPDQGLAPRFTRLAAGSYTAMGMPTAGLVYLHSPSVSPVLRITHGPTPYFPPKIPLSASPPYIHNHGYAQNGGFGPPDFLAPAHPEWPFSFRNLLPVPRQSGGRFTLSGPIGDVEGRMPLPMSAAFVRYDQDGALQQGEQQVLKRDPCRLQLDCRTFLISLESPSLHASLHTGSRYGSKF